MLSIASAATLGFQGPSMLAAPSASRAAAPAMAQYSWSEPGVGATWDPLGLAKTPEKFERLRYVEVKHGRIAMLAMAGHIVAASGYRFPGALGGGVNFADVPGSGFQALAACPTGGLLQIFLFIGFLELRVMKERVKGEFPGDLRNGQFTEGWNMLSESDKIRKRNIELNNGRAAQMGILGLMVHEQLSGPAYVANEALGLPVPF